jgi:hypothetical protein
MHNIVEARTSRLIVLFFFSIPYSYPNIPKNLQLVGVLPNNISDPSTHHSHDKQQPKDNSFASSSILNRLASFCSGVCSLRIPFALRSARKVSRRSAATLAWIADPILEKSWARASRLWAFIDVEGLSPAVVISRKEG